MNARSLLKTMECGRDSLSSRKRWQTALGQRDERIEANG